jgi:hypothetical protein
MHNDELHTRCPSPDINRIVNWKIMAGRGRIMRGQMHTCTLNKIEKMYFLEYNEITSMFFASYYVGHCCTVIRGHCWATICSIYLGHCSSNVILGQCWTKYLIIIWIPTFKQRAPTMEPRFQSLRNNVNHGRQCFATTTLDILVPYFLGKRDAQAWPPSLRRSSLMLERKVHLDTWEKGDR